MSGWKIDVAFFFFFSSTRTYICEDARLVQKLIALPPRFNSIMLAVKLVDANFLLFHARSRFFFFLSLSLSFSVSLNLSRYDPLVHCPSLFRFRSPPQLPREPSELFCHARRSMNERTRVKYVLLYHHRIYIYVRRIEKLKHSCDAKIEISRCLGSDLIKEKSTHIL